MKRIVQFIGVSAILFMSICLGRADDIENDRRSADGLKILQQLGAKVAFTGKSYNERILGDSVVFVRLGEPWRGSIDDLALLQGLGDGSAIHVTFYGKRFTDQWLKAVSKNESIVGLELSRTGMTNAGMQHVEAMKNLQGVSLLYCDLKDDCMKYFDREPSLRFFSALGSGISKTAFDAFAVKHQKCNTRFGRGGFLGVGGMAHRNGGITGCFIATVKGNGAADKAGIQENDIIIKYDGKPVTEMVPIRRNPNQGGDQQREEQAQLSLAELIAQKAPGERVKISVLRRGMELVFEVELGEWP